ncbi:hypothetical protein [Amycolatopsis saalfeldensis]|uniref:DUF4913 domain-containing protein n=1 Tax=Amycolatopsis saalfeldensis TaxID=394193 RepID=A0A1H8YP71_9PSEU|nr:hypothetical protein [Amycolatopsis saalfeldensis]SEP53980.1 hypothetical protein SAMN04489732_13435 [Amycolatopsis saalfeldensis]
MSKDPRHDSENDDVDGSADPGGTEQNPSTENDPEDEEPLPLLAPELLPEVVTELASTSEQHERQLGKLDATVSALDGTVTEQSDVLEQLTTTFAAFEEGLIEKVNQAKPSRWAWGWLTQDEARALWGETRWFVDWFIGRYPLTSAVSIPPCWYRHTVAVDELSDVYAAWREAYCGTSRPTTAMIAWRDRWLWPAITRLAAHANWRECKENRQHVEPSARQDLTDPDFEQFVDDDIAKRPEVRTKDMPWPIKTDSPAGRTA